LIVSTQTGRCTIYTSNNRYPRPREPQSASCLEAREPWIAHPLESLSNRVTQQPENLRRAQGRRTGAVQPSKFKKLTLAARTLGESFIELRNFRLQRSIRLVYGFLGGSVNISSPFRPERPGCVRAGLRGKIRSVAPPDTRVTADVLCGASLNHVGSTRPRQTVRWDATLSVGA
jgi:hypothetical protein